MNAQTLLKIKEKIDSSKIEYNKLEGQKEAALKTLHTDFKCNTTKEVKTKLKVLEEEIKKEEKILIKQTEILEKKIK